MNRGHSYFWELWLDKYVLSTSDDRLTLVVEHVPRREVVGHSSCPDVLFHGSASHTSVACRSSKLCFPFKFQRVCMRGSIIHRSGKSSSHHFIYCFHGSRRPGTSVCTLPWEGSCLGRTFNFLLGGYMATLRCQLYTSSHTGHHNDWSIRWSVCSPVVRLPNVVAVPKWPAAAIPGAPSLARAARRHQHQLKCGSKRCWCFVLNYWHCLMPLL